MYVCVVQGRMTRWQYCEAILSELARGREGITARLLLSVDRRRQQVQTGVRQQVHTGVRQQVQTGVRQHVQTCFWQQVQKGVRY